MALPSYQVPADPGEKATCRICHREARAECRPIIEESYEAADGQRRLMLRKYRCPVGHAFRARWTEAPAKA